MTELPVKIWPYVCQLYSKPNISQACLQLQDDYQFNIPLLLFCCWSARQYGVIDQLTLKECQEFCDTLTTEVVEPLRQVRRSMKYRFEEEWPITETSWFDMREQIKAQELAAERLVLEGMERLCQNTVLRSVVSDGRIEDCTIMLKACFSLPQLSEGSQLLVSILETAFEEEAISTDYFTHSTE